ncbi:MAG: DMT family transporter [Hyphomicrobiaceae bacterium]
MTILLALAPLLFVLLWSSGFVAAKIAVPFAEPCTFLFLRFTIVVVVLAPFVLPAKARPTSREWAATLLAGGLMQGCYLSCVVWSIFLGLPAGVVALTVSLHPITTALLSSATLGERIRPLGWLGFVLGIAGALLVLWPKLSVRVDEVPLAALGLCAAALPFMSFGTVAQKALAPGVPPLAATCIQNAGGSVVTGIGAVALETRVVDWAPLMIGSLLWQAAVVSLGAVALLLLMLRVRGASRAASVFFLVPAGSAALTYLVLGEQLVPLQLAGMVVVTAAVALINANIGGARALAGR